MELVINNENEAWVALKNLIEEKVDRKDLKIEFKDWPTINIHLDGGFDSNITTGVMTSFIELQKNINMLYSSTLTQQRLSPELRKQLELSIKVAPGSSNLSVNLTQILTKMVENLTGDQIVFTALSIGLMYFGSHALIEYIKTKAATKQLQLHEDTKRDLQKKDQALIFTPEFRSQLIEELKKEAPVIAEIEKSADQAQTTIFKGMSHAPESSYQGINFNETIATEMSRREPEKSIEVRLDGLYKIQKVDSTAEAGFKVNLLGEEGDKFLALIQTDDYLDQREKELEKMKIAEWSKRRISLKINARKHREKIEKAVIVEIGKLEEEPTTNS